MLEEKREIDRPMRYGRVKDVLALAILLLARRRGMTIDEIQQEFSVSRRTAERMREAVGSAFVPLEPVRASDRKLRWRLPPSDTFHRLVLRTIKAEHIASLDAAGAALRQIGRGNLANQVADINTTLRAAQRPASLERIDSDLEMLLQAEGLAMRPGPRQPIDPAMLARLREAILSERMIEFSYVALTSGERSSQQVQPYGLLYGNRPFLVGKHAGFADSRLWRIGNMSEVQLTDNKFERDPAFDLQAFARRSFGTYQEEPFRVELLFNQTAAADAALFQFHPSQEIEQHEDGTVTVRFEAGGAWEMCWHLTTWGDSVRIVKPVRLRRQMAQMCEQLASHHREG